MIAGRKPPWATSVLVVEDNEDLRRRIRDSLLMRGFFVEAAADAREAVALLRRLRRDVVVTAAEKRAALLGSGVREPTSAVVCVDDFMTDRTPLNSQKLANRIEEVVAGNAWMPMRASSLR